MNRLLSGFVLDALEVGKGECQAEATGVETMIVAIKSLPWHPVTPVGEGEEYRAVSPSGDQASALCLNAVLVHASCVRKQ